MGNENGKETKDKGGLSESGSSSELVKPSPPLSPLTGHTPEGSSLQPDVTLSPSSATPVANSSIPITDDTEKQCCTRSVDDNSSSKTFHCSSERTEQFSGSEGNELATCKDSSVIDVVEKASEMDQAGIEVSMNGPGTDVDVHNIDSTAVDSNWEENVANGVDVDSKSTENKLYGCEKEICDTADENAANDVIKNESHLVRDLLATSCEVVKQDFTEDDKEKCDGKEQEDCELNSGDLSNENLNDLVTGKCSASDLIKSEGDVASSHNDNNHADFGSPLMVQSDKTAVEKAQTPGNGSGDDSDSEGMNGEFSLSDIDDVVDDLEPTTEQASSEMDATRMDSNVSDGQSLQTASSEVDQSQASASADVGQSQATSCVKCDQSEVMSGEEASSESNKLDTDQDSEHETEHACDLAEKEHKDKRNIDSDEVNPVAVRRSPKESLSESEQVAELLNGNDNKDLNKAKVPEFCPITPDAEDRIDKVCALLDKYKAGKAAKNALDKDSCDHPCGSDSVKKVHSGKYNEENTLKVTETTDSNVKSERSWPAEDTDSHFPVHDFEQLNDEAEHRIAARQAARRAAREIRMREIERQQREAEEKEGKIINKSTTSRPLLASRYATSRQDSEDTEDMQTLKKELYELDERYTKAMMDNAQLDNEKQMLRYEVDLLKDRLEDVSEEHLELQREHKDKCRECDHKKRENTDLTEEVAYLKVQLQQRDKLIEEYGLVFISNDTLADEEDKDRRNKSTAESSTTALVTPEAAEILKKHGEGGLDQRLKQFDEEKKQLQEEIKKLKQLLDEEKERCALAEKYSTPPRVSQVSNGPDITEIQMETQRMLNDYKFKLKKAQQDITTLEGNVIRLESQAKRYKQAAENSERNEEELKSEKRKLQRELREAQSQIEELQTSNQHLQKRLEKMKSARNAILKS